MKLLLSDYDPVLKRSAVVLQHGQDQFLGVVTLDPEDADVESSFAGCSFAEIKARIKMLKHMYQAKRKELIVLENLYHQITQLKNFEYERHTQMAQHIRKQIKIRKQEVDNYKEMYETLERDYPTMVDERLNIARAIPTMVKKQENQAKLRKELE